MRFESSGKLFGGFNRLSYEVYRTPCEWFRPGPPPFRILDEKKLGSDIRTLEPRRRLGHDFTE